MEKVPGSPQMPDPASEGASREEQLRTALAMLGERTERYRQELTGVTATEEDPKTKNLYLRVIDDFYLARSTELRSEMDPEFQADANGEAGIDWAEIPRTKYPFWDSNPPPSKGGSYRLKFGAAENFLHSDDPTELRFAASYIPFFKTRGTAFIDIMWLLSHRDREVRRAAIHGLENSIIKEVDQLGDLDDALKKMKMISEIGEGQDEFLKHLIPDSFFFIKPELLKQRERTDVSDEQKEKIKKLIEAYYAIRESLLNDDDPAIRAAAATFSDSRDPQEMASLQEMLTTETDEYVLQAVKTAIEGLTQEEEEFWDEESGAIRKELEGGSPEEKERRKRHQNN